MNKPGVWRHFSFFLFLFRDLSRSSCICVRRGQGKVGGLASGAVKRRMDFKILR
jgi:hypothetical protein